MATPKVLVSAEEIPLGGHAVSFHSSRYEAASHAAEFLSGTPKGQSAKFWAVDSGTAERYVEALNQRSPDHVGCVAVLPTEQVELENDRLRPVATVRSFIEAHPEGVTAAGGTISAHLTAENAAAHAEYEAWFDDHSQENSRYLCPYDLRSIPPEVAPEFLRGLGEHHSHVVLSHSEEPGARLLELFIFDNPRDLVPELRPTLDWAVSEELVHAVSDDSPFALTAAGEAVVRDWSDRSTIDN